MPKFHDGRRNLLKNAPMALLGVGFLGRVDKVAAMQPTPRETIKSKLTALEAAGKSKELLLKPVYGGEDQPPVPTKADRLPLEWHRRQVAKFKLLIAERGCDNFLLRNPLNIMYLLGYYHTVTERPQAGYMSKSDKDPFFFYPALDRDSIRSFWFGSGKQYFDVMDNGSNPIVGDVHKGPTVDLFKAMLKAVQEKGIEGKRIGVDGELYPSEIAKWKEILPEVEFVNVGDLVMGMREVKTIEELALCSRAYTYFDRAHAFARDYVLTYGTDITDFEVATAATYWASDLLYSELDLANGAPGHGVSSGVHIAARCGRVCAYPHPNQPTYQRLTRGQSFQIDGSARIGGYGGENYRMFIFADNAGNFDPHMQKLWSVSQHSCDMQVELQKEGTDCSDIAYAIHKYQVANGVQKYIYHRPAHGEGSEGHQPPYLALGDHTILKKNMCFSEEPGLFDPETGCGFNWSDLVVTGVKTGYRMSNTPYSKEWLWIKI